MTSIQFTKQIFILLLLQGLFSSCNKQLSLTADYIIDDVTIIDAKNGLTIPNQKVVIQSDKIIGVYHQDLKIKSEAQKIDGASKFILPGLWDMHTHYNQMHGWASKLLIANGVTGVRDMWGDMSMIKDIRNQIKDGYLSPDIYSAGNIVDGEPAIWPGSASIANSDDALAEVDRQIAEGVDFIKVYSMLDADAYLAIAERCKEKNIPFAGHVPESISIEKALQYGQQSMEHLYGILEASNNDSAGYAKFEGFERFGTEATSFLVDHFDESRFKKLSKQIAQSETWICPTLTVLHSTSNMDDSTIISKKRLEYMPDFIRQMWDPANDFRFKYADKAYFDAARSKFNLEASLMPRLVEDGVKLLVGTDFPNPHCYPGFSVHDEMENLVKQGIPIKTVVKVACYSPAVFMNKTESFGSIEPGKKANLLLLNKNPLIDIKSTKSIEAVFLRGKYLDKKKLDQLLDEVLDMANTKL